ncbi:hypothetical protein KHQ89_00445 [Mycoplasmatota bacterium]|nr:hypothetical protein KHQ89_00445 [Mycoplasmatota bacterium]
MGYLKAVDGLPWIVKLLLVIFFDPIVYGIYRIVKGLKKNNIVVLVAGILYLFTGLFIIGWVIDVVTVATSGKVTFLA